MQNRNSLYFPELMISRRLRLVKNVVSLAFISCALSVFFPFVIQARETGAPFFEKIPALGLLAEKILAGSLILISLFILLGRRPRIFTVLFLAAAATLLFFDRNFLQQWFYFYVVLFFILAFYNWRVDEPKKYTPVFNTIKISLVLLFAWDGLDKLLSSYANDAWPAMLGSLHHIFTPGQLHFLAKAGYVIPFVEIFASVALLFPTIKRIAIPALVLIHLLNMLLLGSALAIAWNISMMAFIYILFAGKTELKANQWSFTLQFKPAYLALLLLAIIPASRLLSKEVPVAALKVMSLEEIGSFPAIDLSAVALNTP
jgi:hypothetical protein